MRIMFKPYNILIMLCCLCVATAAYAKSPKEMLDEVINTNALSKTSVVSVSVRNLNDKDVSNAVYERDSHILLHPASTLKLFTSAADMYALGKDSSVTTGVYKFNDKLYLKLAGDPLLKKEDLDSLFKDLKQKGYNKLPNFAVDGSALDDLTWGEGWMHDDSTSSFMPQFSSYNLDKNLVNIKFIPTISGKHAFVTIDKTGTNLVIQNNVITGSQNDVSAQRNFWKNPQKVVINGTVNSETTISVPIYDVENYFLQNLHKSIKKAGIEFNGNIIYSGTPFNAEPVAIVAHPVSTILTDINQNSNNMAAESLFKIAGANYAQAQGTTKNGIKLFNDFYKNLNADAQKVNIVDASGVSLNDLLSTDWMTEALFNIYKLPEFDSLKSTMATPASNGTLKDRLPSMAGNLYAKTGTLSGASALTGFITSQSGNKYAFAIMTQNYKGSSNSVKDLEDEILTTIYQNY